MICTAHPIFLSDQIDEKGMGGACSTCEARKGVYRVLVGKLETIRKT
jgi:hypothetical protein